MEEMRIVLEEEPGCTIWEVTVDGKVHYEIKCGVHKLRRFDNELEAIDAYNQSLPEVRNDRMTFGDD